LGGERVLVDLARVDSRLDEPTHGLDEFVPPAVVERDPEVEPLVVPRLVLELLHPLAELVRRPVAAADEPDAHALADEIGELALDRLGEDLHQELHLLGRT
jgi:hypothetical protein